MTECADDERVCITEEILQNIGRIEVWGEGRGGVVHLEIERIFATGCPDMQKVVSAKSEVTEIGTLANFDGTHRWYALNDPVMGGQSTSNLEIVGNEAILNGTVAIVPSLNSLADDDWVHYLMLVWMSSVLWHGLHAPSS